ncbi:RagB/SusD family nutrient uptake outer membrane protein [Joostella sp.]|uniref:RagB/SusD family nutrient uptake outer membrane protein n=1 Tax=Joostella sp. TaxID=2231138 RepID=UPI003A90DE38
MKHTKTLLKHTRIIGHSPFSIKILVIQIMLLASLNSCSEFVAVDPPKNILVSETVFKDAATVESALANIYYTLRNQGMVSYNISADMGIYADELDYYSSNADKLSIYLHSMTPINSRASYYWTNTYALIYAANDILEGLASSETLSSDEIAIYKGQALFIRAYLHFILINIYGDVPLVTSTDYLTNNSIERSATAVVYDTIIEDLKRAVNLLNSEDLTGEHVIPNKAVANALLGRVYLYTENWELAEETSSLLIDEFELESDLSKVFLKESRETIWQFKSDPANVRNTYEATQFIIQAIPGNSYALSDSLLSVFELEDERLKQWVGSFTSGDGLTTLHFPYKYKAPLSEEETLEYSVVFRLAEQFLIRAEAKAQQGNIVGSQNDLNRIRLRAGLGKTTAATKETLLSAILDERFMELFSEQGHRWFDLKRTGKAGAILELVKPNWKLTDVLWPVPEAEIERNANLLPQNTGY